MDDLDIAVKATFGNAELPALLEQVGEFSLDHVLHDDILREIPVVGSFVGLAKIGIATREYFLLRKLLGFLNELSSVSPDDRVRMIERLESDPSFGAPVGQKVISLLDRLDDEVKAIFASRAFKAYLAEQIDGRELRRLLYAIERIIVSDLCVLDYYVCGEEDAFPDGSDPRIQCFVGAGLLYVMSGYGVGGVRPTETLKVFLQHVMLREQPDGENEQPT